MKRSNKTKKSILSTVAVLALTATATCGAISLSACGDKNSQISEPAGKYSNLNITKLDTAEGAVASVDSGKTYYVSNTPAQDADGSKEKPYDLGNLLGVDEANSILKPGDTVLLVPGTYKISVTIGVHASGAYNSYLKVMNAAYVTGSGYENAANKEVILDFSSQSFNSTARGVQIYGDYNYWYGIDICGAGDNGMYVGGSYNTIEYCEFYNNRDTGLQLGRSYSDTTDPKYNTIDNWPSYNLIKNCTSHNNYDNETYGENADGFAAKLTVGYGNVFDGCIAYRNSDDGWDLYAKTDSGNIGTVIMYNCVAFENGYLEYTQRENNKRFPTWTGRLSEAGSTEGEAKYGLDSYKTRDGDGNGFKLGGSVMEGDVLMYNCLSFNNRMHGVTDNSNPGVISVNYTTSFDNSAAVDNEPASSTFGQIIGVINHEDHGNINMARQSYSYNNISHVLSARDNMAQSLKADQYRASVTDSIFCNGTAGKKANKIQGSIDANTRENKSGAVIGPVYTDEISALVASEIFETLPIVKDGDNYTYNLSGLKDLYASGSDSALNANRVHLKYRNNADRSVNMSTILDVKDGMQSKLIASSNPIGSDLNKSAWEDYTHFYISDYTDGSAASRDAATVARTKEALILNCDANAVYQDFDVPSKMIGCTIEWSSANTNVLVVGTDKDTVVSKAEYYTVYVYRPLSNDEVVKLTATIKCGDVTDTKEFDVRVKYGIPTIGEIYVKTQKGEIINNNGNVVVDLYSVYREPEVFVENGLDYNGKLLEKGKQYTVDTTYMYAVTKGAHAISVKGFTPSNPGVYTVTHTITLVNGGAKKSMTYTVYNASVTSDVKFSGAASVTVNREGYNISGNLTAATGSLYAVSSATKLSDISKENIKTYDGVASYPFRGDSISMQFENSNNAAYYIYYALTNVNGAVTSDVYEQEITVENISTPDEFMNMAGGNNIKSTTIYRLTGDLDFTGKTYVLGTNSFRGLFNGMGHTISGITLTGSGTKDCVGVFYKVSGGTVENVKFNNIKINGGAGDDNDKVGIVGECTGGHFYNIALTDIDIETTGQRAAGLLGYVGIGTPVYIEQVSLVNSSGYSIKGSQRVGGLVGFSQGSTDAESGKIEIYISNCYVDTVINAGFEFGGIYGTYDCGNNSSVYYNLEISSCMFVGTLNVTGSKTFAGGILGYQKGNYSQMKITDCISIGAIIYNDAEVKTGQKNCSGIVGGFNTTLAEKLHATVSDCIALMEEYNSDFAVTVADNMDMFTFITTFNNRLDSDYWTYVFDTSITLKAPYVQLKFLGSWS